MTTTGRTPPCRSTLGAPDRADTQSSGTARWLSSSEHAVLAESKDGYRLRGVAVLPLGELPCHIEYAVAVDRQWRPGQARATITTPSGTREIVLRSRHGAGWEVNGELMSHLDGCPDVDFGWTPATNTVPIRRLGFEDRRARRASPQRGCGFPNSTWWPASSSTGAWRSTAGSTPLASMTTSSSSTRTPGLSCRTAMTYGELRLPRDQPASERWWFGCVRPRRRSGRAFRSGR